MREDLFRVVEDELTSNSSPEEVREKLLSQGYLEEDVDRAISLIVKKKRSLEEERRLRRSLLVKEFLDRAGYGFVPHQFINVLFILAGGGYFWLGVLNALRSVLTTIISSLFQEYLRVRGVVKQFISRAGYLFGFSFLLMPVAIITKNPFLFALLVLVGSVGVVTHGDFYGELLRRTFKNKYFLFKVRSYGVLVTSLAIVASGFLMDKFPYTGSEALRIGGKAYPLYGYLLSFEATALAFIVSGYLVSTLKVEEAPTGVKKWLKGYLKKVNVYLSTFLRNKHLALLGLTSMLVGVTQILGNSYYGVYIYENFKDTALKGFLNVALVYSVAVLTSLAGGWFTKKVQQHTGLAPTLVFGTLLLALLPLTITYNPNLVAITLASAFSVIGAAILGVSQGLLTYKLLRSDERKVYFSSVSLATLPAVIVLTPFGAYLAQVEGLTALFKVVGFSLVFLVAPLYVALVLITSKDKL